MLVKATPYLSKRLNKMPAEILSYYLLNENSWKYKEQTKFDFEAITSSSLYVVVCER